MNAQTVESLILTAIPDAKVSVEDPRGDGGHYSATIASPSFSGKTRLQQHRMVHAALKSLGDKITISITTVAA